ncbi:hypothetical protein HUJ05_002005, partial [Dendroctonus ponderosae]
KFLDCLVAGQKCRESWTSKSSEQLYNLFLDIILLLIPLAIMGLAYFMIVDKLWKGLRREIEHSSCQKLVCQKSNSSPNLHNHPLKKSLMVYSENGSTPSTKGCLNCQLPNLGITEKKRASNTYSLIKEFMQVPVMEPGIKSEPCQHQDDASRTKDTLKESTYTLARKVVRSTHMDKSIEAKRKVCNRLEFEYSKRKCFSNFN